MDLSFGMIQFPSQKYLESIGPSHPRRHLPATGASHGGDFPVESQVLLDRFVALTGIHLHNVAACGNALPVGVVVACVGQNS